MKVKDVMTKNNLVTVKASSLVSEAWNKMKETGIHQVPVVLGNKYVGMLSYRELLRRRSIRPSSKVEAFMVKTPKVDENEKFETAIDLLKDSGMAAIPVVRKGGVLVGIFSRSDILKNIDTTRGMSSILVTDLMSDDPVVVKETDMIPEAIEKMRSLDESEIPVVDDRGRLSGILMIKDIDSRAMFQAEEKRRRDYGQPQKLEIEVRSYMQEPCSVTREAVIGECSKLLIENKLHLIPVVDDNGKPVGVIDVSDIINSIDTGKKKSGILVQVSGLGPWDDDLYDTIFFESEKFISQIQRLSGISNGTFTVHVTKYENGGRVKYSVRTKLFGGSFNMSVDDHDWNFGKCISRIFETYESRIKKSKVR